jgi:hypothetical protein
MNDKFVKILVAANEIGVTVKTIYNWIELGELPMSHPGFVDLNSVKQVSLVKKNSRSQLRREINSQFTRDDKGRFLLLSGKLNGKK